MSVPPKKILIATGGTGGHIYPALMVARTLKAKGHQVSFIGVFGAAAAVLKEDGFDHVEIGASGFVAKGMMARLRSIVMMVQSFFMAGGVIRERAPDVVAGFGGYASFPTVLMAWMMKKRTLIHDQNVTLGEANKILMHVCDRVCVGFRQSLPAVPSKKGVWTGTPFRIAADGKEKKASLEAFGLKEGRKTVFVFGGSQGSRAINACVFKWVSGLSSDIEVQIIHVTGRNEFAQYETLYAEARIPVAVRSYINNIDEAYAAADVAVTRAGAGTVTELALLGVPAVMIPYPGAKNHQMANACVLAERKGTVIIKEKDLSSEMLGDKLFAVLQGSASRNELKEQVKDELRQDPATLLAQEILHVA